MGIKTRYALIAIAVAGLVTGCSGAGMVESSKSDIVVKINVKPFTLAFTEDGQPCQATEKFNNFKGSQVTLKNGEGQILGVSTVNGWNGDPAINLKPAAYAYLDGNLCAYDISFSAVDTSSNFYVLEFSANVQDVTLSREEVISGPVVFLD